MAKSLFDKTYIGKMKLKNRIFMSPMGTTGEAVELIVMKVLIILKKEQKVALV